MNTNATLLIISSLLMFTASSLANQGNANIKVDATVCEALDFEAIKLAHENRLREAGDVLDKAIAACAPDASRLTSRGVLFAAQGNNKRAEDIINSEIQLAETNGDQCRADLSRAELAVIKGGEKFANAPESCKPRAHK